ncbi:MAG: protease inhibitor I42 family protein [Micromonosporaceae bacterium]|nr:protease inhibitor I42 family protein [Micromonosporaceae bacterium]
MTTRIGMSSKDGAVTVDSGEVVELALAENPSTGYRWELGPLPPGAELVSDRVEPAPSRLPGAAACRVLAIRPHEDARLSARLRRSWEPPEAAVESFQVSVTVRPAAG